MIDIDTHNSISDIYRSISDIYIYRKMSDLYRKKSDLCRDISDAANNGRAITDCHLLLPSSCVNYADKTVGKVSAELVSSGMSEMSSL